MEKQISVNEKLDKVIEALENFKDSKKRFHLPLGIRMQQGKIKKNFAIVQLIKTNGAIEFKMLPIMDNTVKVGETYHEATAKHVLRYKKYPFIILPEWNITPISNDDSEPAIKPFSPEDNYREAIDKGKLSAAEKFIIHAIKMDQVKPKMNINVGAILIGLAVIGGLMLLLSQMKII